MNLANVEKAMAEKTLKLTVNEGQNLFAISLGFALPEKLGESKYSIAERTIAGRQVGKLFMALRDKSPMYKGAKRAVAFGPEKAWVEIKSQSGGESYKCIDGEAVLEFDLRKDIRNGAIWCLLVMLHPQSHTVYGAGAQAEAIWTVAEKLNCVRMLRNEIGLPEAENEKSPWDSKKEDSDYKEESVAQEEGASP